MPNLALKVSDLYRSFPGGTFDVGLIELLPPTGSVSLIWELRSSSIQPLNSREAGLEKISIHKAIGVFAEHGGRTQ